MRDLSLDAFRGLAILIMIFVDAPPDFDSLDPILKHAPWEGMTIADLAFPGFVFAMGASVAYSSKRNFIHRSLILFFIGIVFNLLLGEFRLFGILQRLVLTYLIGAILIRRLESNRKILIAIVALLTFHSISMHLYSIQDPFNQDSNLSTAIDLAILGKFDPEGILGTIPSVASMLLGYMSIQIKDSRFGLILLTIGLMWSFFDIICKQLWTAPFVLINAGLDSILLLIFRFAPKILLHPLIAFGTNPLFFFLSTNLVLIILWRIELYPQIWNWSGLSSAEFALSWLSIWYLLAEFFYRRGVLIRV